MAESKTLVGKRRGGCFAAAAPLTLCYKRRRRRRVAEEEDGYRDWANLPKDIIDCILGKVSLLADYERFGAVCRTWRGASVDPLNRATRIEFKIASSLPRVPLILYPSCFDDHDHQEEEEDRRRSQQQQRGLVHIFQKTVLLEELKLLAPLSRSLGGRCYGSSHGWLVFGRYNEQCGGVCFTLVNPFYLGGGPRCHRGTICLPILLRRRKEEEEDDEEDEELTYTESTIFWNNLCKVILSADPADDHHYVVSVTVCKRLYFIRAGDKSWTYVPGKIGGIHDFMFRGSVIYTVVYSGAVYTCDTTHPAPQLRMYANPAKLWPLKYYLAESPDNKRLLLVHRSTQNQFEVFELLECGAKSVDDRKWYKVSNMMGNRTLFLGQHPSTCINVQPSSNDHLPGFLPSSIYFTDHCPNEVVCPFKLCESMKETGIFNMDDSSLHRCYHLLRLCESIDIPPPIWFMPSLPGNWNNHPSLNLS